MAKNHQLINFKCDSNQKKNTQYHISATQHIITSILYVHVAACPSHTPTQQCSVIVINQKSCNNAVALCTNQFLSG